MAEAAARTLNKNKPRRQADTENSLSEQLPVFARSSPIRLPLRACLVFVGFLSSAVVVLSAGLPLGQALAGWLGFLPASLAIAIAVMLALVVHAFLVITLGILLPRRLAGIDAEKTARRLYRLANGANRLFLPLASLASVIVSAAAAAWEERGGGSDQLTRTRSACWWTWARRRAPSRKRSGR